MFYSTKCRLDTPAKLTIGVYSLGFIIRFVYWSLYLIMGVTDNIVIAGNIMELFAYFMIIVSQIYYILQMESFKIFLECQNLKENEIRQKHHKIKSFLLIFVLDMCANFFLYVYVRQITTTDPNYYDPFSALGIINNINKLIIMLLETYFWFLFM